MTVTKGVSLWAQQIRKGSTRLAVLQLVSERERYGYEIIAAIRERTDGALAVAEGNVYPALHALEAEGYITSAWREVEPGVPPRKYYRITACGCEHRSLLVQEWHEFAGAIARLLEGDAARRSVTPCR
jgi:PadR family transcriptional regulator PadR